MTDLRNKIPLILSRERYWTELEDHGLPQDIVRLLRGVIGNHLNKCMQETATKEMIGLAKIYLQRRIIVEDEEFQLCVYKPNPYNFGRKFWVLQKAYPDGEIVRLSELIE